MLDLEGGCLTVAATSTVGEEAMLCRHIALSAGVPPLRALEDAVYDNPMLLADFDRTTILLRTQRYTLIPREVADDADAAADAAALMWTDPADDTRLLVNPVSATGAAVLSAMPTDVAAFLGRTFADAQLLHVMAPTLGFFAAKAPRSGNSAKLFAVVSGDGIDIAAFDGDARLAGAASYACTDAADMAYYAAAAAQVCGIAGPQLHFYVAGDPAARDRLMVELRRFAPVVMPWILPSGMLADGAGMPVPFSLLILPLCE